MALRSLCIKMPALGLRSTAGPFMVPVQSVSPAAASRHMSHAHPGPSSERIKDLEEKYNNSRAMLHQVMADSAEASRIGYENSNRILDEFEKRSNALVAFLYGASAILLIRQLNRRFRSSDDHLSMYQP